MWKGNDRRVSKRVFTSAGFGHEDCLLECAQEVEKVFCEVNESRREEGRPTP